MNLKHSVMLGMLGQISDRFHEYQRPKSLIEQLEIAQQVQGMDGIEIVYPSHFTNPDQTMKLLRTSGVTISALNLNVKGQAHWRNGSFTSPDPAIRARAVDELKTALDLAADLGTDMVTVCPLIDGHNYNFEVNYLCQWQWLEEGLKEGARHRSDIRLSLEYKFKESCNYNILSDVGRTLYLCERIGLPHVGVTLDIGHALIAGETPAEALCMAARDKRLFYVHFNDNDRGWDWDMLPGAVNLWDMLEVIYYLDHLNWDGWLSYDVVTRHGELVESMEASIEVVKTGVELLHKIGPAQLRQHMSEGTPARTFASLMKALL